MAQNSTNGAVFRTCKALKVSLFSPTYELPWDDQIIRTPVPRWFHGWSLQGQHWYLKVVVVFLFAYTGLTIAMENPAFVFPIRKGLLEGNWLSSMNPRPGTFTRLPSLKTTVTYPLKIGLPIWKVVFQASIFRGYECNQAGKRHQLGWGFGTHPPAAQVKTPKKFYWKFMLSWKSLVACMACNTFLPRLEGLRSKLESFGDSVDFWGPSVFSMVQNG